MVLKIFVRLYVQLHPHPGLPPRGKGQNLSPLGEIRKGVKIGKNMTIFFTKMQRYYIAIWIKVFQRKLAFSITAD
jgi:hypothetical protein